MLKFLRTNFFWTSLGLLLLLSEQTLAQVGCGGFNGAPSPTGGAISLDNGELCLNRVGGAPGQISITAFNVADGSNPNNFAVEIDWDDGSARQVIPFGGGITVLNTGPHNYSIPVIDHAFLPRPCASRPGAECSYRPRVYLRIAGATCPAQFGTSPDFFRFNTDDQCSGDMQLSETVSGATIFEVCAGASTIVTFTDRTTLNCLPPQELTALNSTQRWRNFVYGTTNTITGTVTVGGTPIAGPFPSPVVPAASPQPLLNSGPPFANNNTLAIAIPATAQAGEEFHIQLNYWNFCNPYPTDASVVEYGIIRIVAQPVAPTPVDQIICNGDVFNPFRINFAAASSRVFWYQFTGSLTTPGALVGNPNGNNSKSFPTSALPGGFSNTTAGVYQIWASYQAQVNAGGLLCESVPVLVSITVRDAVPVAGPIAGTAAVCNGSSGVGFSVPTPANPLVPGGPTEYVWDVVDASNGAVADVTLAPSVGSGATAQNITAAFAIANGTFGGSGTIIRKIRVRRKYVNSPFCQSTIAEFPVTVSRATDIGTTSGGGTFCEGANLGNITWNSPGWGQIVRWERAAVIGGPYATVASFGTSNPVSPNSLALTPGTHFFRAQIQNGSCPMLPSGVVSFTINANPDIADAGPDDAICVPIASPLTYTLAGNASVVPTRDWALVSGPAGGTAVFANQTLNNTTVTVNVPGVYRFSWLLDNVACQSVDEVEISFGRDPAIPAPSPASFCGLTGSLGASVLPIGGEIITWSLNSGPGTAAIANANVIPSAVTVTTFGTYVFTLTYSSGSCVPQSTDVNIDFFQPATSTPEANKTVCVDGNVLPAPIAPFAITGTVGGGATTGRWEIASGSGTFSSSGAATGNAIAGPTVGDGYVPSAADYGTGSVILRLVAIHPNAPTCANAINLVTVSFDRKPANAIAGVPFDVCGTTTTLGATIPTANGIGTWTIVSPPVLGITDPSDRNTAVSNLQFGPNIFQWNVNSLLGFCAPSTDQVTITRVNAPVANNLTPAALCETIANTLVAEAQDLTTYNNAINGGAGTTVSWFRNAARTVPVVSPTNENIANGEIFYVRVSTIGPPPVCTSDAVVSFTVVSRPFVSNLLPSLCESGLGTGIVDNTNLTDFDDDVALNAANRAVTWFLDATLATSVPTPTDVDGITNSTTFYARVENTVTGCFNTAIVTFSINPIPTSNPIIGANTVCLDPNAVIFYTVTTYNPGYSYQWTVPPGVTVTTGSTSDFFLLLQFPGVVVGGIDLQVVETSPEGCPGLPETLHVDIEDQPGALTITGPPEVCEFATDVVFTVPLFPNITYSWSVPPGASIILGQGSEEIHVNFGSIAGDVVVTPSTTNGCIGPMAMLPVAINRRPILASLNKTLCSLDFTQITLSVAGGSEPAVSYNFVARVLDGGLFLLNSTVAPPQIGMPDNVIFDDQFENKTVTPLNVRYTIAGVSAQGCVGPSGFITVRVNPEPQLNPNLSRSVCSDEETEITLIAAENTFPVDMFIINNITIPPGVTPVVPGDIPVADGITLYPDDILFNNRWNNTTGANQIVSYEIIPYSTLIGCAGNANFVNVTVYPRTDVNPVAPIICNGDPLNITFSSTNNPDATFLWLIRSYDSWVTINGPAAGSGNVNGLMIKNNSLTQDGTLTFEVYGKNQPAEEGPAGCQNPILTFTVTVLKSPEANAQNLSACSDSPGGNTYTADLKSLELIITPQAGDPDTKIIWYRTDPRLGPATIILDPALNAFVMGDGIPVFVEVEYIPTGCKVVVPVQYEVNPAISVNSTLSDFNGFNLRCNADNSGEIRIDVLTGTPAYSYRIDGGPFINAGVVTYTFSSLAAGSHTVEVQDIKGCTISSTIDLIEPAPLTATLNIDQEISCFLGKDGIISTVASGGTGTYISYLLLQTNTTDPNGDGIFDNLGAGTYNVRVTDLNNCKVDSGPVDLIQPTQVEINSLTVATDANGFHLSCRDATDGEIEVTFSGGNLPPDYTITLTNASDPLNPFTVNTPGSNAVFANLGFGNYTAIARDWKNCESLPASAIIVNPPPFSPGFVGINQSICVGDNPTEIQQLVPAFGGVGNYQYQWQQSLTGSNNDAEWIDIPGATSITFDPVILAQTTYFRRIVQSVSERTGIACETLGKDNIVQITINPLPVASFAAPSEVCQGEAFTLQLGISVGTAPIEYDYSAGTTTFVNLIGTENTAIPISNFQDPTTYTLLRVKDLNGCLALNVPQSVQVDVIKINPAFTVLAPVEQCSGETFTFQWVVEVGVKYTWIWSDGQQDVLNPGDRPIGVNIITHVFTAGSTESATIYPVRLQAENALCTPKTATNPIKVFPTIVLNISPGDPVLCSGETIRFNDQSKGVDVGKWYYQVVGTTNQQDVRTGPVPEVNYTMINNTTTNPIIYEVVYEASNNEGCTAVYKQEVKVYRGIAAGIISNPDPPTPFAGGVSTVTFTNNSVPLDDTAFEYTWDFGDVRANPPTGTGIAPYTVDYFSAGIKDVVLKAVNIEARDVDNKTCQSVAVKKINIELPILGAAFKATPLASCFPVNITVENLSPGADTFLWELYDQSGLVTTSNLRNPVFRILQPGTYDIYLTASYYATGQTATANQKGIEVFDVPTALFEMRPNPIYVPDTELQTYNQSVRANQYLWDFDDGSTSIELQPRHFYKLEGKYNVTLVASFDNGPKDIDGDGVTDGNLVCYDTVRHELQALNGGFIKLPNAFTPNLNGSTGGVPGNGTFNDVFLPIARGVEEFQMQIFDRWGNLIFESKDRNIGWDGYDRHGRLMSAGVYVYKLILRLSDGQRTTKVGDVTLIK